MAKRIHGIGVVGAVVAAALGTAVGCGDGFASGDCHESHTCAAVGGSDGDDTPAGGAAGSDAAPLGGASPIAGAADAGAGGVDAGCTDDAACSNGNAEDGAEVCDNGACLAGNPPPTIVSVTPESDAVDVEPDTTIVIEFSEPLDQKTVIAANIRVQDGSTVVPGTLSHADGKVTFTPAEPLALLAAYTLSVTTGVKDADGAPLLEALSSTFSIRDGEWHAAINVVKDTHGVLSDILPMTSDGSALLVWSGSSTSYCPAWARWFLRGVATTAAKSFAIAGQTECNFTTSAGNAAGVNAVIWSEPDAANGTDIVQFRDGAWQAAPVLVTKEANSYRLRLAVAPNGQVTFFEHVTGASRTWTTDAAGKWPAAANVISSFSAEGRTSVAFDAKGNGLAVWHARDKDVKDETNDTNLERIVASRLTAATGKWATAEDLPGSVPSTFDTVQRSAPVVAIDSQGDAMALWIDASFTGKLMASRYLQATGWAQPEPISGALVVNLLTDAPALVFDGQAFVAAWTAGPAGNAYAYTARYDLKTGWGTYEKQQTTVADGMSTARMPRLASDGRGNLLLVFATGESEPYTLVSQRYANDAWSAITPLPGGAVEDDGFKNEDILPLSQSANGLAALAWANYTNGVGNTVRLASFY